MAGTFASTVIGAILVIIIARLLGPAGYGLYSLSFVLPALSATLIAWVSSLISTSFGLWVPTTRYGMRVDLRGSLRALVVAVTSAVPILPLVYYSPFPSLVNVLIGAAIYLAAYLTLAPVFKAIRRTDLEILAPILGQIRILRPATNLIFAYETRLLNMLERKISTT